MSYSLFLFIVFIFCFQGYIKGPVHAIASIAALLFAYSSTLLTFDTFFPLLLKLFNFSGLLAYIFNGIILFSTFLLLFRLLLKVLIKNTTTGKTKSDSQNQHSTPGALISLPIGIFVGLFAVWGLASIQSLNAAKEITNPNHPNPPSFIDNNEYNYALKSDGNSETEPKLNILEKMASSTAGFVAKNVVHQFQPNSHVVEFSSSMVAGPSETLIEVNRLLASPEIQDLFYNDFQRTILNSGDEQLLIKMPEFKRLAMHPDMISIAQKAGINDPVTYQKDLASAIMRSWRLAMGFQNDPVILNLLSDPELSYQINSGDIYGLLANPKLAEIGQQIFQESSQ